MRTGKAGEYRVASELMLRGIDVFMTINDMGTDIIAQNGCRIQVKCARNCLSLNGQSSRQIFTFKHEGGKKGGRQSDFHKHNDIVVLWAISQQRFFIIPARLIRWVQSISLTLDSKFKQRCKLLKYEDKWHYILNWRKS